MPDSRTGASRDLALARYLAETNQIKQHMQGYGVIETRTRRAGVRGRHAQVVSPALDGACGRVLRRPYVAAWYRQLLDEEFRRAASSRRLAIWISGSSPSAATMVVPSVPWIVSRGVLSPRTPSRNCRSASLRRQAALNQDLVWRGCSTSRPVSPIAGNGVATLTSADTVSIDPTQNCTASRLCAVRTVSAERPFASSAVHSRSGARIGPPLPNPVELAWTERIRSPR